ncbi:MAG: methionine--tRNA ligase [Planctomycetes bacterium]|nr:methionine--tRNA ligase [Planctomycetota bacterium]
MSDAKFYITTAIDYVNSRPHLGTAYEKVTADVIARYRRLRGDRVFFLMGNDEHSLKVEQAARQQGLEPEAYCDRMEEAFTEVWKLLDIDYDDFIRTSQERHKRAVAELLTRIHANGDVYQADYEGWYCNGCEAFKNEGDLVEGRCPDHVGLELAWLKEKNHFFRLSRYQDFLVEHYAKEADFVRPEVRKNELLELLRGGLKDISISRESASWGVPVPFDPDAVVYVWFDALINYVAGVGWPDDEARFQSWWPADLHLVGKDITRFHCIIWPAMLKSAGLPLPRAIFGHGFVNLGKDRMSKSLGTIVDPKALVARYGADAIRFYLCAEATFGRDLEYGEDRLAIRANSDLANGLGNLLSRAISMLIKYRDGVVPAVPTDCASAAVTARAIEDYRRAMDALDLKGGVEAAMSIVIHANKLVDDEAPWALAKDPSQAERLDRVLYELLESCRAASVLLGPVMPTKMRDLRLALRCEAEAPRLEQAAFGGLAAGTRLEKIAPLFPRIDPPEES